MHHRLLKELTDVVTKSLSNILKKNSRLSEEVSADRNKNFFSSFNRKRKEDLENCKMVSLMCAYGKIVEHILLEALLRYM